MHTDTDQATYYATMRKYTGHSRRYLMVRAWVRTVVAVVPVTLAFVSALIVK